MSTVTVLMATYNGARYLSNQLDSLLAQTHEEWELYVRDDNSTDNTRYILETYHKRDPRIHILPSDTSNIGPCRNFAQLMERAHGQYLMFCDQDDIWLEKKIEMTLKSMKLSENRYGGKTPILVYTDAEIIDSDSRVISQSFMKYQHLKHVENDPLRVLLIQNFVSGCTVMINRPLLLASLPIPEVAIMYDWWLALVAAAIGQLIFVPYPTLFYRQHGDNVVGAKKIFSRRNLVRLLKFKDLDIDMIRLILQGSALMDHLIQWDTAGVPSLLVGFLDASKKGGRVALEYVIRHGIMKQGFVQNFLFYLLLAKDTYSSYFRRNHVKSEYISS